MIYSNCSVRTKPLKVSWKVSIDFLLPKEGIRKESVRIRRDTWASQFSMYAETLRKFGQIQDTIFILDGDQRNAEIERKIQDAAKRTVPVLFLPGSAAPESWVWDRLKYISDTDIEQLGINRAGLSNAMNRLDALYDSASDTPSEIAKSKFRSLSEDLRRDASEICRIVARLDGPQTEKRATFSPSWVSCKRFEVSGVGNPALNPAINV